MKEPMKKANSAVRTLFAALLCATLLSASASSATAKQGRTEITQYEGRAYDLKTGRLIYIEDHREYRRNGRHYFSLVYYRYANRRVFARKRVRYGRSMTTPSFTMIDFRKGYMESVRARGRKMLMRTRETKTSPVQSKTVAVSGYAVVDEGFDYAVRQLWSALPRGRSRILSFAVPGRLDYYRFQITGLGNARFQGKPARAFRFRIASRVLQLLADDIYLLYDPRSRRLLEYRGLSNIAGRDGKNHRVRVVFDYAKMKKTYRQAKKGRL